MPIEGPLSELGLVDLLQLVHLSRKTGRLRVRSERGKQEAELYFERGAVVGARAPGDAPRIGELLVLSGKATQSQVDRALVAQRASPGRRLGEILVEREGVPRPDVERQLRFQIEEAVFDVVRWSEGAFSFEEQGVPPAGAVGVRLPTEGLLMEAMRRADEWSSFGGGTPDTDLIPGLVENDQGHGVLSLQPLEWEVLAAVDGETTLRAIARKLGMAEFDVARAVFTLASTGVVDLGHRAAVVGSATVAPATRPAEADVRSALQAGRLDDAERQLNDLMSVQPDRGDLHALGGEIAARRGDWKRAMDSLEAAVLHDPLLARAYYALGMAALRLGSYARARTAFQTYLRLAEAAPGRRERAGRAIELTEELESLLEEERR